MSSPPEYEDETREEPIEVEPTTKTGGSESADPIRNAYENLEVANNTSRMSENYGTSSGVPFFTEYQRDQHILLSFQHPRQPHTFAGSDKPTTVKQGRPKLLNNKLSLRADSGPLEKQTIGRGEQLTTANQISKNLKKRKRTDLELDLKEKKDIENDGPSSNRLKKGVKPVRGRRKQSAPSLKPPIEAQLPPTKEVKGGRKKSFPCTESHCKGTFSRESDRKRHIDSTHSNSKFGCIACKNQFCRADALKRHERSCKEVLKSEDSSEPGDLKQYQVEDTGKPPKNRRTRTPSVFSLFDEL